jgi:hydroxymethylpyrimidine pyrophosphatase-like HAD family hydrolase
MLLATDLDGTFLGGTERDRQDLYAWLRHHNPYVIMPAG